nr:transmembrane ascorbate ferrireductase 1 [Quercus suber]
MSSKNSTNRVVFNVNFINFLHENQPNNIEKINLQWLYGFLVFFYPGGSIGLRSESVPWHVLFGLTVFILAVGNAAIGLLEKLTFLENSGLAKYGSEALLVNFTAVITILFGAFVILSVLSQSPIEDENNNYTSSSKSISLVP